MREAERFAKANAGKPIPPDSIHGHRLLALATERSTHKRKRLIVSTSVVAIILALIIYVVVTAPPTPDTGEILNLAVSGQSEAAYVLAQQEHAAFPDDLETMLWLSVLAEVNGDMTRANQLWITLQSQVEDQNALLYQRGNTRLLALNLDRAAEDAQLLQQSPATYPEGIFLEAGIAEARGDGRGELLAGP